MSCCCDDDNFDPGVNGSKQVFRYVADGMEANPFTVNLPGARGDINYNVQITLMRPLANAIKEPTVVAGTLTMTTFDVELGASLEANDVLMFTVEQLT